jgi:hypothetical protein
VRFNESENAVWCVFIFLQTAPTASSTIKLCIIVIACCVSLSQKQLHPRLLFEGNVNVSNIIIDQYYLGLGL